MNMFGGESSYLMWGQKYVKIHYIIYIISIRRKEFWHSVINRIVKLKITVTRTFNLFGGTA